MKRVRIPTFLWLLATGILVACSQGEGEPCQVDDDCSGGLACCRGDAPRGVCADENSDICGGNDIAPLDASIGEDASPSKDSGGDEDSGANMSTADAG